MWLAVGAAGLDNYQLSTALNGSSFVAQRIFVLYAYVEGTK